MIDVRFTYEVTHPALSHPIEIDSHIERSDQQLKWSVVHMLETQFPDSGWDWVEEMVNMAIDNRSPQGEDNCQ